MKNMERDDILEKDAVDLSEIDVFDLSVTEVSDGAAAFAVPAEGSGGCLTCGCFGGRC
ncbi:hypothetical protein RM844_09400 [Streptomyces sp. DSM 44915]|uniref:Thiazolylpeptide-type bacteriocin n=1 Tax=Streptomyces chisholmiae TaxID=3075540 RepID=A0ABU2JNN8_9ACTN|nr:hypothetical protein [Streptomyces sp. DSM 44915]MDT0266512.1 hypothetical protein [Streptomyces sp. DSM 44915]